MPVGRRDILIGPLIFTRCRPSRSLVSRSPKIQSDSASASRFQPSNTCLPRRAVEDCRSIQPHHQTRMTSHPVHLVAQRILGDLEVFILPASQFPRNRSSTIPHYRTPCWSAISKNSSLSICLQAEPCSVQVAYIAEFFGQALRVLSQYHVGVQPPPRIRMFLPLILNRRFRRSGACSATSEVISRMPNFV